MERPKIDVKKPKLTFAYYKLLNKGRITLAIRRTILEYDLDKVNIQYEAGISYCSPEDNFCKEAGRTKALMRLENKNPEYYFTFPMHHFPNNT